MENKMAESRNNILKKNTDVFTFQNTDAGVVAATDNGINLHGVLVGVGKLQGKDTISYTSSSAVSTVHTPTVTKPGATIDSATLTATVKDITVQASIPMEVGGYGMLPITIGTVPYEGKTYLGRITDSATRTAYINMLSDATKFKSLQYQDTAAVLQRTKVSSVANGSSVGTLKIVFEQDLVGAAGDLILGLPLVAYSGTSTLTATSSAVSTNALYVPSTDKGKYAVSNLTISYLANPIAPIHEATIEIDYKQTRSDLVGIKNYTSIDELQADYGKLYDQSNPLPYAVDLCLQHGVPSISAICVAEETTSEFKTALNYVGKERSAYWVTPLTEMESINQLVITFIDSQDNPYIGKRKQAFLNINVDDTQIVAESKAALEIDPVSGNRRVLKDSNANFKSVNQPTMPGYNVKLTSSTGETFETTVTSIITGTRLLLADAIPSSFTQAVDVAYKIYFQLTEREKKEYYIGKKIKDFRISSVFMRGFTTKVTREVNGVATEVTETVGGVFRQLPAIIDLVKRSEEYIHQPLIRATISAVTNVFGTTDTYDDIADLIEIAEAGFIVPIRESVTDPFVYQNFLDTRPAENLLKRNPVTISIVDYVCFRMQNVGRQLIPGANITQAWILEVQSSLCALLTELATIKPDVKVGPMLVEVGTDIEVVIITTAELAAKYQVPIGNRLGVSFSITPAEGLEAISIILTENTLTNATA